MARSRSSVRPSPERATLSIWKNQRRGIGAALAAWAIFLLLAGGLAGYVVVYSDSAEAPQETAQDGTADKDGESGEETTVAASKPSLAVASEKAEPSADAGAAEDPGAETNAVEGSDGSQPEQQQPLSSETPAVADAPVARPSADQEDEPAEGQIAEDETEVAAKAEVNGVDSAASNADEREISAKPQGQKSTPPPVPDQDVEDSTEPAEQLSDTTSDNVGDATSAKASEGETQVALRAPPPAPAKKDEPPWQRYSAYFLHEDTRPRVAIIMTGLGMSDGITEAAIKTLPPEVTLSFSPYARNLAGWIGLARVNGHEVLLDLYMEPSTYPLDDPGPQAIMTVLSEEENRKRLNWVLSRGNSYVGLTGRLGSRLLTRRRALTPIMNDIAEKGLVFIDDRATAGSLGYGMAQDLEIPAAYSEGLIDEPSANRTAIDAKLNRIERIALTKGAAVALAQPYPVTIERLSVWIEELSSRGVALAPITAVVNRQPPMR